MNRFMKMDPNYTMYFSLYLMILISMYACAIPEYFLRNYEFHTALWNILEHIVSSVNVVELNIIKMCDMDPFFKSSHKCILLKLMTFTAIKFMSCYSV